MKPEKLVWGADGVLKWWCAKHQQPMTDARFTDAQMIAACKRLLLLVLDNPRFQRVTKGCRDEASLRYGIIQVGGRACCLVGDEAMAAVYAAGRKYDPPPTPAGATRTPDAAPIAEPQRNPDARNPRRAPAPRGPTEEGA